STLPTRASRVFEPRLVIRMAAPGSPSSRYSKKVSTAASACCSANGLPGEISRSGGEHAVIRKSATTPTGKYAVSDRFVAMHLYLFISRPSPQTTAFAGAVDLQHPIRPVACVGQRSCRDPRHPTRPLRELPASHREWEPMMPHRAAAQERGWSWRRQDGRGR